jgi:hypothetical protein
MKPDDNLLEVGRKDHGRAIGNLKELQIIVNFCGNTKVVGYLVDG